MRIVKFSIFILIVFMLATAAQASILDNLVEYKLANGLQVYLLHRDSPTATVMLSYKAGSKQEWFGATGLAHYLEHCSSLGTTNFGPRETSLLIENEGGNRNASTNVDCTRYYADVPSSSINLLLDIEADRMQNCLFPEENVLKEREVIQEELRWRYDNRMSGKIYLEFMRLMFPESAYSWTAIGKADDLTRLTRDDLLKFYTTNYVPANAHLIIVGGFDQTKINKAIKDRFEFITRGTELVYPPTKEPSLVGIRQTKTYAPGDSPMIRIGWPTVPEAHPDSLKLTLLGIVLSGGTHSYLDKEIVYKKQLLSAVGAGQYGMVQNGIFSVSGVLSNGVKTDEVNKEIFQIINDIKTKGITSTDLITAKNMYLSSTIYSLQSNFDLTEFINSAVINEVLDRDKKFEQAINSITAEDIKKVAQQYLSANDYVLVEIYPQNMRKQN